MNMRRNFKLATLLLLLIITAVYFSVPFISKYLIERNLPVNIQLLKWDISFLGFNELCVKQATLKIDLKTIENKISIQNTCINYFSKNIAIGKIVTESQERQIKLKAINSQKIFPINIPPIFLPRIDLSSINHLGKIGKINIASFQSQLTTQDKVVYNLVASNITFKLTPDSEKSGSGQIANFNIKKVKIDRENNVKTNIFHGEIDLKLNTETINLFLSDSNNKEILILEFNQTLSQTSLDLILDQKPLTELLKAFIPEEAINYLPSESINIEIVHDLILSEQSINFSSIFNQLDTLSEPISVAVELLISNQPISNKILLQLAAQLTGKDILFEVSDINESKQIKFNQFTSLTNVKLATSKNKLTSIDYLNNVINIDQLGINEISHTENNNQVKASFNKLRLSVNSDSSLPLDSFKSIAQNISARGKITGKNLNSKIISDGFKLEIGKTDFDNEPTLSFDFKIDKQNDSYHSSGNIRISSFLADAVITNKPEHLKNKLENIKTALKGTLSWDNLSMTINSKSDKNTNLNKTLPTIHSSDIKLNIAGSDLITSKLDLTDYTFNSKASINDNSMIATAELDISEHRLASIELTNKELFSKNNEFNLVVKNSKIQHKLISQLATSFLTKFDSKNETSLSINQGTVEHDNTIDIGDKLSLKSNLALREFDVDINSIFLIGLNYKQNINSLEPLNLSAELGVREVTFASGLLLSNISTDIDVTDLDDKDNQSNPKTKVGEIPSIVVSNLKANIWNGEIQSESIVIEEGILKPSTIDLKNIDLTEMIFFLDMKGLYADGDIDIHLPIAQQGKKYIVKNGHFTSNKTGIIKYDSGQEQIDVEANIALHALQNFHYEKLDGTINYDRDGAYAIKLHLLGSNPSLYDGYPIDFELNLSGELSDVFQSVFLTGDFEKSIIERAKMNQLVP